MVRLVLVVLVGLVGLLVRLEMNYPKYPAATDGVSLDPDDYAEVRRALALLNGIEQPPKT